MKTFHVQFVFVEIAITVVEAGLAGPQAFNFCASQHNARNIFIFKIVFVVCLAVTDFQSFFCKNSDNNPMRISCIVQKLLICWQAGIANSK